MDSVIVIDNGSYMVKAGVAGDDSPSLVLQSAVGISKPNQLQSGRQKSTYIGQDVFLQKEMFDIYFPIQRGLITNWDSLEKIYENIFLKLSRPELHVLHSEPIGNPKANREKLAELMFETFQ